MTPSPRLHDAAVDAAGGSRNTPPTATEAQISTLIHVLHSRRARSIGLGHGRDDASRALATAFATAWNDGGIISTVDWPETAASWLRPARRLVAGSPDAWVLTGTPASLAQVARRLAASTSWDPRRALGLDSIIDPATIHLAGQGTLEGARGVDAKGRLWRIEDDTPLPIHEKEELS